MNAPSALAALALCVSVGALAVALSGPPPESAGPSRVADAPDASLDALVARVDSLEDENRALRDELELMATARGGGARAPRVDGVTRDELATALDGLRAELGVGDDATAKAREESVYESMWRESKERRESEQGAFDKDSIDWDDPDTRAALAEEFDAKREANLEVLEIRMMKFEDQLGLDRRQSDALRGALLTHADREAEWTRRWAAGEDVGELKASDAAELEAELEEILTPEQLEQYHAMNGGGSSKGGGGSGGSKGGGGGGGGAGTSPGSF